jgi:hypothetical protein
MERSRLASVLGPDSLTTFAASFKHSGFVGWLGLTRLHGFGVRVVFFISHGGLQFRCLLLILSSFSTKL